MSIMASSVFRTKAALLALVSDSVWATMAETVTRKGRQLAEVRFIVTGEQISEVCATYFNFQPLSCHVLKSP